MWLWSYTWQQVYLAVATSGSHWGTLIGLAVIPNMEILHEVDKSLMSMAVFEKHGADKNWEVEKWGGWKKCWSRRRHMEQGGPVQPAPLSLQSRAALFWGGLKLGTFSTTNCILVPFFMNIHPGVFRPHLISREIEEETRTFYHKRSISSPLSSHRILRGMLAE